MYTKWLVLVVWMVVIFVFSSQGHEVSSGQSQGVLRIVSDLANLTLPEWVVRKGAHIFLYFVLGLLAYNVLRGCSKSTRAGVVLSVLIVLAYATSDELHQLFVPGRSGELRDVAIDTAAATIGVSVYVGVEKWYKLRNSSK